MAPDRVRIAWFLVFVTCEPRQGTHEDRVRGSGVAVTEREDARADGSTASPTQPFVLLPCQTNVLGHAFRGATILCIAFQAASITSVAVIDPARNDEARTALEALLDQALTSAARRGFPRNSVLYRGLLALVLAGLERVSPNNTHSSLFDETVLALTRDLEGGWLQSYQGETYPCDHAPALSALRLHAILRGSSPEAADRLAERLRSSLEDGFPCPAAPQG